MTFVTYQGYEKTAYPQYLDVDNEVTLYASPGASYQVTVCSGDTGLPAIPLGFTAGSGIPQTLLFTSVPGRAVPGLLIPGWAPDPPAPAIPHMEMAVMEPDLSAARDDTERRLLLHGWQPRDLERRRLSTWAITRRDKVKAGAR